MASKNKKDELSFDFGKIKKFFKSKENKKSKNEEKADEGDFSFDLKSAGDFLKKYKFIIVPIILIIICMGFGVHYRMYTARLPITDEWAANTVHNFYRSQIADEINRQYPNLPQENKDVLINRQFQEYLSQNKDIIEAQIRETSEHFKSQFQDDDGRTYLVAIDPYFYYRGTRNLLETGMVADELKNDSIPWDNKMVAPIGVPADTEFHHYFSLYTYKIFRLFNRDISLMGALFYTSIIMSALCVIPAFFIAKKIAGNVGGFFAAFILAIHPVFLNRTMGGFSDTDAYTIFFPLMTMWIFLEAFEAKDLKKKLILGGFAGLITGLFSTAWGGWWYIFNFILTTIAMYIAYYLILHRKDIKNLKKYFLKDQIKNSILLLSTFFVSSAAFVTLFKGSFQSFMAFFINVFSVMRMKEAVQTGLWPNVYTTVAELNPASVIQVIRNIGGNLFFFIALVGLIMTITSEKRKNFGIVLGSIGWYAFVITIHTSITSLFVFLGLLLFPIFAILVYLIYKKVEEIDIKYALLLIIWFLATIYASTLGVRFVLLLVPAFAVAFGVSIGKTYDIVSNWASNSLSLDKILVKTVVLLLLLILLINPMKTAASSAKNQVPSMNDGWYETLTNIRDNSSEDAIITSWWDFGHWFKAIAERAVTFDGASQGVGAAHWVGKALLSDDDDMSMGIIRMLNCGSNRAFEALKRETGNTVKSIDILYEILPERKDDAEIILRNYVSEETTQRVLELTKCEPRENYFITSEDMVSKAGVWSHFGGWDFKKAMIWDISKTMNQQQFVDFMKNEFEYDEENAIRIYYEVSAIRTEREASSWISPWPGYASGLIPCQELNNDNRTTLICQNGIEIDLEEMEVSIPTNEGVKNPYSIGYMEDGNFKEKRFENNTIEDISVNLIKNNAGNYNILLSSKELVGSMFTRLFYYDGEGLDHFEKFSDKRDVTGARIIVWKIVNWENI